MANGYVRRRSISGPVILILLGSMFLLANFHVIYWPSFGHWFARFWPLLLILVGAIKLAEYYADRRQDLPSRGLGAGTIVLIVFLIIFGFAATKGSRVDWNHLQGEVGVDDEDLAGIFRGGEPFTFTNTLQQDFPAGATLHVASDRGDVVVKAWDQPGIKVEVQKKLNARNQDDANKADRDTQPTITVEGTSVTVNANTAAGTANGVSNSLNIYIPRNAAIDVATKRGDITVQDRTGVVHCSTARGDINVDNITGNSDVEMRHGDLHVNNLKGNLNVSGQVNDTSVSGVVGAVTFNGEFFGEMNLAKLSNGFNFRSSRTDMEAAKLDGDLKLDSGDLRARNLAGPFRIVTRSKDIHLDDVSGDIRVENSNGVVEVHTSKATLGNIQITNQKGDIRVFLPSSPGVRMEAHAHRGDIETDFPVFHIQGDDNDHSATGGEGASTIQLTNQFGDIEIRKAT